MTDTRAGIIVRALNGWPELEACTRLQEQVWGEGFRERVPPSLLLVAQRTGGVVAGAFSEDKLVGFVFGVTGLIGGRPVHWSDMLAVLPGFRDQGIGERLKRFQRERLLELGVERVLWTADPLEARNAHLNLSRLGATSSVYERDMYGEPHSPLHRGLGTDRLIIDWEIGSSHVERALGGNRRWPDANAVRSLPAINQLHTQEQVPTPVAFDLAPITEPIEQTGTPRVARLAIPADIQSLKQRAPDVARVWRRHVRDALEGCFDAGLRATALVREGSIGWYVVEAY